MKTLQHGWSGIGGQALGAALILLFSSLGFPAQATTYYVDEAMGNNSYNGLSNVVAAGSGPKLNVYAAIDAASDGATIVVDAGEYAETAWDSGANTFTLVPQGTVNICGADLCGVDTVDDGIPDWWRLEYFGSPVTTNSASCASCTSTNPWAHGLTNLQVYQNPSVLIASNYSTFGDDVPDWWRVTHFGTGSTTNPALCASCTSPHPWAHGLTNLQLYQNPSVLIADNYSTLNDGIPDWWKVKYGLLLNDPGVAYRDADGDGYTNLQEYNSATDPQDANSHPGYLPPDFAGWWKFDEGSGTTTVSAVGTNLTGTLTGDPPPAWCAGVTSNALAFDGAQNEVLVNDDPQLSPTNALAITAWVKTATNMTSEVAAKWSTNTTSGSYILSLTNGQVALELMLTGSYASVVGESSSLSDTNWHHIAGTYDGSEMQVYLDGASVGVLAVSGTVDVVDAPLRLGLLLGQLDDVRLYNYALSPNAIAALYAADSDGDGIPDVWEADQGLNSLDPTDANQISANSWAHGLTNLQVYQNPSVLIADNYSTFGDNVPDWWRVTHFGTGSTTNPALCASCTSPHPWAHGLTNRQLYQNPSVLIADNYSTFGDDVPDWWRLEYYGSGTSTDQFSCASCVDTNPWANGLTNLQVFQNPSVLISNNYTTYNDGIPDWWRVKYFGTATTNSQSCAACDADNSFWSNLADYENGVDPRDKGDAPPLTFTIDGGTNPVTSTQLNIQLAAGIVADYVVVSEDFFLTSVTNSFSSSFGYTLMSNVDGFHTVYLQLLNTNGIASTPFAASVQVEQGAPVIWISSPTNGTTIGQRQIDVQGFAGDAHTNASAPLQVTVNGTFVNARDTNGNWWSAQDLTPGTNTFLAVATGVAGLATTNSVWIIYDPALATNTPNFTLDVTNTVTVGSNTTAIAVSGSIDDSNATIQIIVLNASDNTITNAVVNAAVVGTNWWGNVPVAAGSSVVIVSAQNSGSPPATNRYTVVQNTNVFLVIDSPVADTDVNATNVLVIGHASTNFNQTITINGQPALTSTGPDGITFSNSVRINNMDANIVEVNASGSDGSSAIARETIYGYELQAFHSRYHGGFWVVDIGLCIGHSFFDWDPSHANTYHVQGKTSCTRQYDWDWPCSFVCGSLNGGDVCLNLSGSPYPEYGNLPWAYEGDFSFGDYTGSWDSQFTVIKHSPVDEEQLVVFHFTSFQYSRYCADPMGFDPSQITFRGAQGFWYIQNGQTNGVAFLIKIRTNTPFTIQASDFQFPSIIDPCGQYGYSDGTVHEINFTGFGNHPVPTVNITGATNLYVFCSSTTPQEPLAASVTPSEPGTFTWNSWPYGYLTITPNSPPSAQPNWVFVAATDVNHVSGNPGDVQVEVTFYPADGSPYVATNMPVSVLKPAGFSQPSIVYSNPVPVDAVDAWVSYRVVDQLCGPIPAYLISGMTANESLWNKPLCYQPPGPGPVHNDGTVLDNIAVPWGCQNGIISYQQAIAVDCATVTNSISTYFGTTNIVQVNILRTGGLPCPQQ